MVYQTIKSPNFSKKGRKKHKIKFVIIHYTGMQSKRASIERLTDPSRKVSCHYLIDRAGDVIQMIKDNQIAWHAGKSKWKKNENLNESSIGIELVNKGHRLQYQSFTKIQINGLIKLCKILKKNYKIKNNCFLGHSDIAPLRKSDPGEKFPWLTLKKKSIGIWYPEFKNIKNSVEIQNYRNYFFNNIFKIGYRYFHKKKSSKNDKLIIKAFQRRFLPSKVDGKIDQKTLKISHYLANSN